MSSILYPRSPSPSQAVITEDSDLLPFGAPRVLFKMGKDGRGQEVQLRHLPACEELSFLHWTDDM